jgi:hypothetical protein
MAGIKLTAVFETPLDDDLDGGAVARAFRLIEEEAAAGWRQSNANARGTFQMLRPTTEGHLRWSLTEEVDAEIPQRGDANHIGRTIESAAALFEDTKTVPCPDMDILTYELVTAMRASLEASAPLKMTVRVPLRHNDQKFIGTNPMAFVEAALARPLPFSTDLRQQTNGMAAEIEGSNLVISGPSARAVGKAAAAFVRAPRPTIQRISKRPLWAYGTIALLAVSFALSWFPLSPGSIFALSAITVATTASALLLSRRHGLVRHTAVGLVPVLIVISFAVVYAIAGQTGEVLRLQGEPLHLRDPLLLSLSLASTVGVLDLSVSGWLRSIAYLEMLLVVGYLSAAVLVTVKSLSVRLDQTIRELRFEREER